jgi:hypothetical protein
MTTTIIDGLAGDKAHYARETDLSYDTWAVRLITATMQVPSGSDYGRGLFEDLDEDKEYTIYEQQGASPAATDFPVKNVPLAVLSDDLLTKIGLIGTEEVAGDISVDLEELLLRVQSVGFVAIPSLKSSGSRIDISTFVGEQQSPTIPTNIDLTEATLEIAWEPESIRNTTEIATLSNEELTVTSSSISFLLPQAVYSKVRKLKYSCRQIVETSESTEPEKTVIFYGEWNIISTALKRD